MQYIHCTGQVDVVGVQQMAIVPGGSMESDLQLDARSLFCYVLYSCFWFFPLRVLAIYLLVIVLQCPALIVESLARIA